MPRAASAARAASRDGGGRPAGGGDEGAGWESEGGFVDSGPLSFDTKGYDWGPYAAEMIRKIKRNWEIPKLAHYGLKGRLVIRFYLMKDGRVESLRVGLTGLNSCPLLLEGTDAFAGRAVDETLLKEVDRLVQHQSQPMRTTLAVAHYRRLAAAAVARRLVQRLAGA